MENSTLTCFGVGDGWPCADRNHSAFLYKLGGIHLLFDCGEPISRLFKASGLSYDTIDRIFISHLHFDHIGGFFMLIQGFWLEQRQKDLHIHLPSEGVKPIRELLNAGCVFDELLAYRMFFEPLAVAEPVAVKRVKVTPFPSTHLESLRHSFQTRYPQAFQAFCFLIESDRLRIGHSADIGSPQDLAPLVAKPLDLLVCELAHFKPADLFDFLRDKPVKRIIFMHVGRKYLENLEEIKQLAADRLPGVSIAFAHDGEEFQLTT